MEINWEEARKRVESWETSAVPLELQGVSPALEIFGIVTAHSFGAVMEFSPVNGGIIFRLRADDRKLRFFVDGSPERLVVDASGDLAMRLTLIPINALSA